MEQKIPLDPLPRDHRLFEYEPPRPWVRYLVGIAGVASIFGVVILVLALALPISMLVIGVRYRHPLFCPAEPRISRFLIVNGSVSLVALLLSLLLSLLSMFVPYTRSMIMVIIMSILSVISLVLQIFLFIWLIVGSVWTFRIRHRVEHIIDYPFNFPVYCERTLYQFTFAYLILMYILMAFTCAGQCCMTFLRFRRGK